MLTHRGMVTLPGGLNQGLIINDSEVEIPVFCLPDNQANRDKLGGYILPDTSTMLDLYEANGGIRPNTTSAVAEALPITFVKVPKSTTIQQVKDSLEPAEEPLMNIEFVTQLGIDLATDDTNTIISKMAGKGFYFAVGF